MALVEFIVETLCATFYEKGETSQPDLGSRLRPYNTERPQLTVQAIFSRCELH
jgi:hypothetical protein